MKKNNISIIGIIILAVAGVVAYSWSKKTVSPADYPAVSTPPAFSPSFTPTPTPQLSPTPTPNVDISDWKTYRNEKYGFEFRHPQSLILEEKTETVFKSFSVFLKSNDLNGYILVNNPGVGTGFDIEVSSENILIDGLTSKLEILDSSINNERAVRVTFTKNKNDFFWLFRFNKSEMNKLSLIKKYFSTFKFSDKSFSCGNSTVNDVDGNIYKTVQIGSQCWLKENLKVTKSPEGKSIIRYCYDNDPKICETDGGLYDWNTAMNNSTAEGGQGICPSGWHMPKDSEWYVLERGLAVGKCLSDRAYDANGEPWNEKENERIAWGCSPAGKEIKVGGSGGFMSIFSGIGSYAATFSNDLSDSIQTELKFRNRGLEVDFWSSTGTYNSAWIRSLDLNHSKVYRGSHYGGFFYSVRCLKD